MLRITAEGSTYLSVAGLRKLQRDIDKHLRALAPHNRRRR